MDKTKNRNNHDQQDKAKLLAQQVEELTATCKSYRRELKQQERNHAEEIKKVLMENDSLQLEMGRVQEKLEHWKSTCQRQQNESVVLAKSKFVKKENDALKEDLDVLKSIIARLNKELAFYQSQLRKEYQSSLIKMPQYSSIESNLNSDNASQHTDLNRASKTLLPLLTAYDESIEEKNGIIREHERLMEEFKTRLLDITEENKKLHELVAECNSKGTVSSEEWKTLYDNAVVVLQENDLLHEKIDVLNRKIAVMESTHTENVEKLKKKVIALDEDKKNLNAGLAQMQNQSAALTAQITKLGLAIKERIPMDQHEASVNECKREFEQLRSKYNEERKALNEKLSEAASEIDRNQREISTAKSEIASLKESIKNLEKSNLEYAGSLVVLRKELSISVKALQLNESSVREMMKVAEAVQHEKEVAEKSLLDQRQSMEKIMAVRNQEVLLLKDFEEKLRAIERDYEQKLQHHISRASKLEEYLETIAERHQADLSHLHDLVKEKTLHIETLNNEKRQLMEDLETVWRATTKEQQSTVFSNRASTNKGINNTKKPSPGEKQESSAQVRRGSGDNL